MTGGASWSKHAYGVAIDINPLQNPYISYPEEVSANILPPSSSKFFVNRNNNRPNKKQRAGMAENVIDVFARHGFIIWGGDWDTPIDYQHFEVGSYNFIHKLINRLTLLVKCLISMLIIIMIVYQNIFKKTMRQNVPLV